ncbi:MAG: outer membrane beta-barrel protein [Flavobacteriaceae bacterium]|nr:outer membrane beta-barrel protein [Flavobacteriaceae bacterium]
MKAEHSKHYSTTFDANFSWKEEHHLKVNLQGYYNDVNNLITLVARKNASGYEYNNIEKYKTRGGSLGASYFYKNWLRINASSIFTARYNNLSSVSNSNDFTHSWDWIMGVQCNESTTQITLTADWKAYGKQKYFYYDNSKIKEGYQSSYQMLNLSASRRFWQNRLQIVVGARNLADVTNVKLNGRQTSSGHGGGDSTPIAYGRTFFIKANFRVTK